MKYLSKILPELWNSVYKMKGVLLQWHTVTVTMATATESTVNNECKWWKIFLRRHLRIISYNNFYILTIFVIYMIYFLEFLRIAITLKGE